VFGEPTNGVYTGVDRHPSRVQNHVVEEGVIPATQHVRASNFCHIGVFADRLPGRAIVISAIDNLVKGSAGQALQNFNLMFGFDETTGLEQLPLFP